MKILILCVSFAQCFKHTMNSIASGLQCGKHILHRGLKQGNNFSQQHFFGFERDEGFDFLLSEIEAFLNVSCFKHGFVIVCLVSLHLLDKTCRSVGVFAKHDSRRAFQDIVQRAEISLRFVQSALEQGVFDNRLFDSGFKTFFSQNKSTLRIKT